MILNHLFRGQYLFGHPIKPKSRVKKVLILWLCIWKLFLGHFFSLFSKSCCFMSGDGEQKTDLRNGLLSKMTAISARLAPIPIAPKEMRIVAAVWSVGWQINVGPEGFVSFSPLTPNLRPGPTTTAIIYPRKEATTPGTENNKEIHLWCIFSVLNTICTVGA